jgi:hypothetical protein
MPTPLDLPVPDDPIQRVRRLARDLAYGVLHGKWTAAFQITPDADRDTWNIRDRESNPLQDYITATWQDNPPRAHLLLLFEYTRLESSDRFHAHYVLTPQAFALLDEPAHASIFISYSRKESSAFALLVLARLKAVGLDAFLDMKDLELGEDWHARLEQEIKSRQVFICLVAPTSLASSHIRDEIQWALEANARLIPVCHNGFRPEQNKHDALTRFIRRNAIIVENENAKAYNNAIIELLNYFGYTP